ncbi:hypothetical protein QAD02_008357 [Eretmocerus hayati]|uniref:Uncharacterized protein n=1 Tax=Eretmocerus hayati TaxID=131215 RepID=A0ACC2N682_9HYME|nr:hypothetical protein QAD02_008357 [Eretmocerus hayati]
MSELSSKIARNTSCALTLSQSGTKTGMAVKSLALVYIHPGTKTDMPGTAFAPIYGDTGYPELGRNNDPWLLGDLFPKRIAYERGDNYADADFTAAQSGVFLIFTPSGHELSLMLCMMLRMLAELCYRPSRNRRGNT